MNKAGAQKEESTQLGLALMNADYRSQGYTDQISLPPAPGLCRLGCMGFGPSPQGEQKKYPSPDGNGSRIPENSHFSHGLNRLEFYYNDMKVGNILSEANSEVSI